MAIIPETQYPGKTTAGSASYPYGGAQNVTAPGDGTGTPWEAALLNDIFGLQQAILSEAGITPSGSPETALASQYKEATRAIMNMRLTTHDMASDANYTLTTDQNNKRFVKITDTGVLLSTGRDIIVDLVQKRFIAKNDTLQILTFKTAAGTGIAVPAGGSLDLYNDGVDVVNATSVIIASTAEAQAGTDDTKIISPLKLHEAMLGGVTQAWTDVIGSRAINTTYTNTTGRPIQVAITLSMGASDSFDFSIDGAIRQNATTGSTTSTHLTIPLIIPNGSTYRLDNIVGATVQLWHELR